MTDKLNSSSDIERISYDILKQSKAWGVFPTPVDDIVNYVELKIDENSYINDIPKNYLSKSLDVVTGK